MNKHSDTSTAARRAARGKAPRRKLGRPPVGLGPSARERLIAAARRLFARDGYAGTSVHAIAAAANVADSALYAHFAGKAQIYALLLRASGPQSVLNALVNANAARVRDPREFFRRVLDETIAVWSSPAARTFTSIFLRDLVDGHGTARGIFSEIDRAQDAGAALIRTWQADGTVALHTPARLLVWEIFAPLVWVRFVYFHARATRNEIARGRALAAAHVDYVLNLLFG
jgi:AcrR family transcriptional regulator